MVMLVALAVIGLALGYAPVELLRSLIRGAVGSRFAFESSIIKTIPLLLTGLSVAIAFRAGVWNIGAEGQFVAGGIAALIGARYGVAAALVAGLVGGALWATLASFLRVWRNASEVLSTILLNFVAIHLLGWCVNGPLRESSGQYPQSDPVAAVLPPLGGTRVHVGLLVALIFPFLLWWFLTRTTAGLRLRATGFNPDAVRFAGIVVERQIMRAMAVSGALAGLAGGIELLGVTGRLFERFASGYGYSGIAVALLARLHPIGAIGAAFFFGALATGAGELQRAANVSSSVATLAQALVILVLVLMEAFARKRWSTK